MTVTYVSLSKKSLHEYFFQQNRGMSYYLVDVKSGDEKTFLDTIFLSNFWQVFLKPSTNWKWWSNNDFPKKLLNVWDGSFGWERSRFFFQNFCNKSLLKDTKSAAFSSKVDSYLWHTNCWNICFWAEKVMHWNWISIPVITFRKKSKKILS